MKKRRFIREAGRTPRPTARVDEENEWVGIMRHSEAQKPDMKEEDGAPNSSLTIAGLRDARGVAERFVEMMASSGIAPDEVTIACAPTQEARDTAAVLTERLKAAAKTPVSLVELESWPADAAESPACRWKRIKEEVRATELRWGKAVVVVGHDPQVSWLLHHLVADGSWQRSARERGLPRRHKLKLPLTRGELAMLAGADGDLVLKCVLSPSDPEAIEQLHEKIKSKMDTAKLLGAFLTALFVFAAKELSGAKSPPGWYPWLAGLSIAFLAAATAAYFVTMFHYDQLLMPVRFWPSARPKGQLPRGLVSRPPSSASWVLYQNMMRVWNRSFVTATVCGGVGLVLVSIALVRPSSWYWWLAIGSSIVALVAFTWMVWVWAVPKLGVSD
jgi:phosphohistidine phosphatase SixA